MPIRAVLFDFDGTLADSFAAITASTNHVRDSYGLPPIPEAGVRRYVGHGLHNLMEELCPGFPTDEAVRRYREHHPSVMNSGTKLFPGVAETLRELHRRGVRQGVCSNKAVKFSKELTKSLGLGVYLSEVLGPEDAGGNPKPDPTMLLEACRRLGVEPSETVYVGDMSIDVHAGRNAGIPVWLVHAGMAGTEDPLAAGPDRVLDDFARLTELVPTPS